jgi:DNA invertase Pin-like site-specific DNA recombinase
VASPELVGCVVYAAKSTEDLRGSIPDQLRECREAIEREGTRVFIADYVDESFSAFHRNRGPGLVDAMRHAEDLAEEHGSAELWALHSDRLARGDGRTARHAVEIALWALKCDVRVRTVQDPDTFRDLLYAVVTGQRNHEDSRRRGLAVAAGYRRAVERGDYTGAKPDGYRVTIAIDENGHVRKRLEIDPARQPAIAIIFRLALAGKRSGAIARALNEAGWQTKPMARARTPKAWDADRVLGVLHNPRYAGLAVAKGEVVARGSWEPYISERQHERILARVNRRRPTKAPRPLEPYLLAGLGRCGFCGATLYCHTGDRRNDGTFSRRYVCRRHARAYERARCPAPRVDAEIVEAMFVTLLRPLLTPADNEASLVSVRPPPAEAGWADSSEHEEVLNAIRSDDERRVNPALERLFARMAPEADLTRRIADASRHARQVAAAERFESWAAAERMGRTDVSRAETRALNQLLRTWFSHITLALDARHVAIVAHHRQTSHGRPPQVPVEARFDRRDLDAPLCVLRGNRPVLLVLGAGRDHSRNARLGRGPRPKPPGR